MKDPAARPAPIFAIGDWAYDSCMKHNAKIVGIYWDDSLYGWTGGWRYSVPGFNTPDMMPAREGVPNVEFVEVGYNCYKKVEEK